MIWSWTIPKCVFARQELGDRYLHIKENARLILAHSSAFTLWQACQVSLYVYASVTRVYDASFLFFISKYWPKRPKFSKLFRVTFLKSRSFLPIDTYLISSFTDKDFIKVHKRTKGVIKTLIKASWRNLIVDRPLAQFSNASLLTVKWQFPAVRCPQGRFFIIIIFIIISLKAKVRHHHRIHSISIFQHSKKPLLFVYLRLPKELWWSV